MTISDALKLCRERLASCSDEAAFEAHLIIMKATGLDRPVILSHPERELSPEAGAELLRMLDGREKGTPLPYLLGSWSFFGFDFRVTPAVLIPRPETELMVERAAGRLKRHPDKIRVADIGAGSGCIGITLLKLFPDLRCTAVDISRDALLVARENALALGVMERYETVQGDLTAALSDADVICANLPYIPTETCALLDVARQEPMLALDGGADGFDLYRKMFADIAAKPRKPGLILCELEYRQRRLALETAARFFPGAALQVEEDLAGMPRLLTVDFEA